VTDAFVQLWFASRYVHVVSIAVLAGGAVLACAVCARADAAAIVAVAFAYEWIFWAIVGLAALTGVSNLGLKGDGLLDASTGWGTALTIKLASVLALLAFSLVRTDVVSAVRDDPQRSPRAGRLLGWLYGCTTTAMCSIAWLGLGLAHGRY